MTVWRFGDTGLWKGVITWQDGRKSSVTGRSKADAEAKMMLRASGIAVNKDHNQSYRVSLETVRYALSLLLPLDHVYRLERQRKAVDVLEAAIRHAEANVEYVPPDALSAYAIKSDTSRERSRPAWLDALPMRANVAVT